MTTLIIIQIILFLWFPVYIWIREGEILSSISAASYRLEGNAKGLFTGWLALLAFSTCGYIWFDVLGVWAGIMAVGFTIAGMSPDHRRDPNSLEDAFHTAGTVMAIAAGFAGLLILYWAWQPVLVFGVAAGILAWRGNKAVWWIEILAMATMAWGLLTI